jgi:hypothetical protein
MDLPTVRERRGKMKDWEMDLWSESDGFASVDLVAELKSVEKDSTHGPFSLW